MRRREEKRGEEKQSIEYSVQKQKKRNSTKTTKVAKKLCKKIKVLQFHDGLF